MGLIVLGNVYADCVASELSLSQVPGFGTKIILMHKKQKEPFSFVDFSTDFCGTLSLILTSLCSSCKTTPSITVIRCSS